MQEIQKGEKIPRLKATNLQKQAETKGKGINGDKKQPESNHSDGRSQLLHINTQSKCKQSGFTNKKTQMLKKKKKDPTICCLQETHFSFKDTQRLKVRGQIKVFDRNENRKKGGIVILMSDKIDFEKKR